MHIDFADFSLTYFVIDLTKNTFHVQNFTGDQEADADRRQVDYPASHLHHHVTRRRSSSLVSSLLSSRERERERERGAR